MKFYENELYQKGYKHIAGLDEVGRGCWAGPLVVAICVFHPNYENKKINDSKKLNEKTREELFQIIINDAILVDWVIYEPNFVDKHNPKKTSIIGMEYLLTKHKNVIDYALLDAEKISNQIIPFTSIIKGDTKSQTIAAASIIAKVIRDRIMSDLDKKYPQFYFKNNKGYGTQKHLEALEKFGALKKIHRFSYKPIQKLKKLKDI